MKKPKVRKRVYPSVIPNALMGAAPKSGVLVDVEFVSFQQLLMKLPMGAVPRFGEQVRLPGTSDEWEVVRVTWDMTGDFVKVRVFLL